MLPLVLVEIIFLARCSLRHKHGGALTSGVQSTHTHTQDKLLRILSHGTEGLDNFLGFSVEKANSAETGR